MGLLQQALLIRAGRLEAGRPGNDADGAAAGARRATGAAIGRKLGIAGPVLGRAVRATNLP